MNQIKLLKAFIETIACLGVIRAVVANPLLNNDQKVIEIKHKLFVNELEMKEIENEKG